MLVIEKGFGFEDKVWALTFGKDYQIAPIGTNKRGESLLERKFEKLKEQDNAKFMGRVGLLSAQRYSNIKEIKQEKVLVKEFVGGIKNKEVLYNKEFEAYVIYFKDSKDVPLISLN